VTDSGGRSSGRGSLESVQVLRAVAALSVLFAHLWPTLLYFGVTDAIPNFIFGAAGVDLFFVISGFIMVYTAEPLFGQPGGSRQFLIRRIVRIVPMYWSLTFISLIGRKGLPTQADLTWANIIGSYLFIPTTRPAGGTTPALSVGWTLNYEMLFYVLFSVAVFLPRRQAVFALTAFLFALVGLPMVLHEPLTTPWSVWTSPFLCEFVFGMWVGAAFLEGWRLPPVVCIFAIAAGFALMVYTYQNDFVLISRAVGWGGGSACIVAGVVLADTSVNVPRALRPLVAVGDASYALYLVHTMVPPALFLIRVPRVINPVVMPVLYCVIVVAVALLAAFVLNSIDRRVRTVMLERLSKVFPRKKAYGAETAA
jgi:exopolysaccharide production protein ExoZ